MSTFKLLIKTPSHFLCQLPSSAQTFCYNEFSSISLGILSVRNLTLQPKWAFGNVSGEKRKPINRTHTESTPSTQIIAPTYTHPHRRRQHTASAYQICYLKKHNTDIWPLPGCRNFLRDSTFIFPVESWNCSWISNLKGLRILTGEKRNPVWYKISKERNTLPLGSLAFGLHVGLHLKWKCQSSDSSHISDNHNSWSETNVLTNCAPFVNWIFSKAPSGIS